MRAGLRYAWSSPELQRVMLRGAAFFLFGSGVWAMLPLIARSLPGAGAALYGILLAAIGAGAVTGALLLPRMRAYLSADGLLRVATLLVAGALVAFAFVRVAPVAVLMCFGTGIGWIIALTTLGASVQSVLPDWVRGRGLALYLTVFYGAMSLGSLLWGAVASGTSLQLALAIAAAGAVLAMLALWVAPLPAGNADLSPAQSWPDPVVALPVTDARGPVCVMIEYRIDPARRAEFLEMLHRMAAERRRNGAYDWRIHEDVARPGAIVEIFLESSWAEHQRHHSRVTATDADLQAGVLTYHLGNEPPVVRHLLAV
jgi:MFS family permease